MRTLSAFRAQSAALLLLLATLTACDDNFQPGVPGSIKLSEQQVTLIALGQNHLLTARVKDEHGKALETDLVWSTSDPFVVVVNGDGLLTATGVGSATVTASAGGVTDGASVQVAQAPAHLASRRGDGQTGPASQPLPSPLTVQITDALNRPIPGVTVDFASPDGGSVDPASAVTDYFGEASTTFTLGANPGSYSATATVNGTALSTTFHVATGGPFSIEIVFVGSQPTPSQAQAFQDAKQRWEGIIQGDLPDDYASLPAGACGNSPAMDRPIDDLVIFASVDYIDGPGGILGQAGPCFLHSVGLLPAIGQMTFDIDDLNSIESMGLLSPVILHEMGHALGYGSIWPQFGLLVDPVLSGGTDPHFTGLQATTEFDAAGGLTYLKAKVPVEDQGPPGTADAHWRESVFGNELMTGYINQGFNPLSAVSLASLADMGYLVDLNGADPYTVTGALRAPGVGGPTLHLHGDVRSGPVGVLGRDGKVSRWLKQK